MTAVMQGVRILEVAEHTFVPAASALMADWGAEVIKIEHVERGDAMRGARLHRRRHIPGDVHILLEHSNRGKKSLGLDLTTDEGLDILYKLAATCDVFLTNKLPQRPQEAEDRPGRDPRRTTRRSSTCAVRVKGERGPDADKGSYDSLAFWARAGVAMGCMRLEYDGGARAAGPGLR